jgi:hypothetical protein
MSKSALKWEKIKFGSYGVGATEPFEVVDAWLSNGVTIRFLVCTVGKIPNQMFRLEMLLDNKPVRSRGYKSWAEATCSAGDLASLIAADFSGGET